MSAVKPASGFGVKSSLAPRAVCALWECEGRGCNRPGLVHMHESAVTRFLWYLTLNREAFPESHHSALPASQLLSGSGQ